MKLSEFQEKHEGDLSGPALEDIKSRQQAFTAQLMVPPTTSMQPSVFLSTCMRVDVCEPGNFEQQSVQQSDAAACLACPAVVQVLMLCSHACFALVHHPRYPDHHRQLDLLSVSNRHELNIWCTRHHQAGQKSLKQPTPVYYSSLCLLCLVSCLLSAEQLPRAAVHMLLQVGVQGGPPQQSREQLAREQRLHSHQVSAIACSLHLLACITRHINSQAQATLGTAVHSSLV